LVPLGYECRLSVENIPNMLSIKNSSALMISVSDNFLVESEWLFFVFSFTK